MLMELAALGSPFSVTLDGGQSGSLVVYGSALASVIATIWALCERSERRSTQTLNVKLSNASQKLTEQHYRERLQAEERHLMTHDSYTRNVLESLERAVLGKPKG
jgi:hypothetical protein